MNTILKKLSAVGLSAVLTAGMLAGCGAKDAPVKIDGSKVVTTVNDEEVQLGVVSFYAKYQQAYLFQMYSSYFGTAEIFDTPATSSSDQTYGEQMRDSVLENVEDLVLLSQHAEEYGVSLTEEELKKIDGVAQAYIDENSEEVREEIGASFDNVVTLLKLQTVQSKMYEPLGEEVDQNVSDEEAQQSTVSYVVIPQETVATESSESETEAKDEGLEKAEKVLVSRSLWIRRSQRRQASSPRTIRQTLCLTRASSRLSAVSRKARSSIRSSRMRRERATMSCGSTKSPIKKLQRPRRSRS